MFQTNTENFPQRLSKLLPSPLKNILRPLAHIYFRIHDGIKIGRQWAKYYWFRARGGSWTDYYRERRDKGASAGTIDYRPSYLDGAKTHFDFLAHEGLKPTDRFLDYGAGYLRLATVLVPYLQNRHYTAADISAESMKRGQSLLEPLGISRGSYQTITVADCDLSELDGSTFDVIWAQSVLTHMPLKNIRIWFKSLPKFMANDARVYFTFAPGTQRQINVKDFYYEPQVIEREARKAGFHWRLCNSWDDGGLSLMVCLTL